MKAATIAGLASTVTFAVSTLPMVLRAARSRDLSSYSRSHLVMTNAGNAMHTVYVASLPPGPIWLLHFVHTGVAAFMIAAHVTWTPARNSPEPPTTGIDGKVEELLSAVARDTSGRSSFG